MKYYYHDFTVGFNSWYVFIPAMMVLTLISGAAFLVSKEKVTSKKLGVVLWRPVVYRNKTKLSSVISDIALFSVTIALFLTLLYWIYMDSILGLMQFIGNGLNQNDSPKTAAILALVALIVVSAASTALIVFSFFIGAKIRLTLLRKKCKKHNEEVKKTASKKCADAYGNDTSTATDAAINTDAVASTGTPELQN